MNELNIFSAENYFFNIHSLPMAITSLVIIILGLSIFFREKASFVGWLYLLYSIPLFLWLVGSSITHASVTHETALYWAKFTNTSTLFIPATFYLLSIVILNEYSKYRLHAAAVWIMTLIIFLIMSFSDSYVIGVINHYWGYYVLFGQHAFVYILFFTIVITNTLYMYWSASEKAPEQSIARKRSRLLFIGFVIGTGASIDFLPAYGFDVYPIGFIFILILVAYTTYVVWHYNLVDITPEFASNMLLEAMSEAVIVLDSDNIIRLINNSTCQLFPLKRNELLNENISIALPQVDFLKINNELSIKNKSNITHINFSHQNKEKILEVSSRKLFNNSKSYVGCLHVIHDVTSQYEAEQLLKNSNEKLEKLVDERTAELFEEKEIAEKANLAKSEFLTHMSHELRTPLNAVLGFAQLLNMELQNEKYKKYVEEIVNAGNHLLELINDVLDLSKIEAGKLQCTLEDYNLNKMINESISFIEPLAAKHSIQIINNISSMSNYTLHVDNTRFKQVMLNFLSNAVKYNGDKGTVTLSCNVIDNNQLRINVSDTGNGLTEKEQQLLFKPFERIGEYKGIDGTGIGLTISKHLIELMNGNIGVESEIGKGSNFWIQIPLS